MVSYPQLFSDLTELLSIRRPLWAESAFVQDELSWQTDHPRLYQALCALSEAQLQTLEREDALVAFVSSHLPCLEKLGSSPIAQPTPGHWQPPEAATYGVPARKGAQIGGFVRAVLGARFQTPPEGAVVDWCSGRGYLAHALHLGTGSRVTCLERDVALHRHDLAEAITFVSQDVLVPLDPALLHGCYLHTALHACGDLHLSMLRQTAEAKVQALALSPCCYHFTQEAVYRGLSGAARNSRLVLSRDELRLATAEMATASSLDRKLRHREQLWRVAFDLHLRSLRGIDSYSRIPSVKKSLLKTSFPDFAQALVDTLERKGRRDFDFAPLSDSAEAQLMARAQAKLSRVSRLEKAQLAFRRVLERWLLLDQARFLEEHGYQVRIEEFCAKHHSGRNQVILART